METSSQPYLRNALVVSLLLHGGLLFVILLRAGMPDTLPPQEREYIEVSFVRRAAIESPPAESSPTESPPVDIPAAKEQTAATPKLPAPTPASPPATNEIAEAEAADSNSAVSPREPLPSATPTKLDPMSLQQSIGSLALRMRGDNLQRWMQDCKPERNKELPDDCPTRRDNRSAERAAVDAATDALFDSWISGHDRNDRISRQLLADMNALRPLMEQKGLLAELASERYYFKREQYRYLNGMEATPGGSRDSTIRWATFDPGGITLLGGLMRIEFNGTIKWGEEQSRGPALPFRMDRQPCDYAEGCDATTE